VPGLAYGDKNGLAVDSRGNLHVLLTYGTAGIAGRTENRLVVLSPEGKYLRSAVPFRASTPREKLAGVDFVSDEPGRLHPRVYERVCTTVLPQFESLPPQTMAMTAADRLVLTSGWATELYGFGPRSLLVINADGGIPRERFNGPVLVNGVASGIAHVGVSPDGRHAYVTGLADGRYYEPDRSPGILHHTVLRAELKADAKPEVFFGKHKTPGAWPWTGRARSTSPTCSTTGWWCSRRRASSSARSRPPGRPCWPCTPRPRPSTSSRSRRPGTPAC